MSYADAKAGVAWGAATPNHRVWLDGTPAGAADAGQTLTLPLPPATGERRLAVSLQVRAGERFGLQDAVTVGY